MYLLYVNVCTECAGAVHISGSLVVHSVGAGSHGQSCWRLAHGIITSADEEKSVISYRKIYISSMNFTGQ